MTVVVLAHFEARGGCEDSLGEYLLRTRDISRLEAGCVSYDVFAETGNAGSYVVLETWSDETARQDHITTATVDAFRRNVPPMLKVPYTVKLLSILG
jgi:quinol monooxygenase YgiN